MVSTVTVQYCTALYSTEHHVCLWWLWAVVVVMMVVQLDAKRLDLTWHGTLSHVVLQTLALALTSTLGAAHRCNRNV
jgi:hypothetical protein